MHYAVSNLQLAVPCGMGKAQAMHMMAISYVLIEKCSYVHCLMIAHYHGKKQRGRESNSENQQK